MKEVVILSAQRTAIGSFMGSLSSVPAPKLGAAAIKKALEVAKIAGDQVQECIMGNVLTAGVGQAPARQAAIYAGLPQSVECLTINKVCGSGLKAVMLASDSIRAGNADVIVAGGQENMSLAPHLLENVRNGYRMGPSQLTDSMIKDGLWDPYNNMHMGNCGEICAKEFNFTREAQDQFAIDSYKNAQEALKSGAFKNEIVGVEVQAGKQTVLVDSDEEPTKAKFDKIPELKPAFDKTGTITAANASKLNDGAAALVIASGDYAKSNNLKPMARIVSYASFAQDPKWFTTAPAGAIKKALTKANLKATDIDLWEINEAFAVVTMAAIKEFNLDPKKVNVNGGAIALGHPIGASGARVLTTLLHTLEKKNLKRGLATLCIGGGEGAALIVERL
ncbi:MAG: thiolase family protein [Bdellovibrionota bacterium]